jgi:hypothetical protein
MKNLIPAQGQLQLNIRRPTRNRIKPAQEKLPDKSKLPARRARPAPHKHNMNRLLIIPRGRQRKPLCFRDTFLQHRIETAIGKFNANHQ